MMAKAAVVILAGTERHENLGRIVDRLETAKEFTEIEGDELEIIFDGAGTQWIPELKDPDNDRTNSTKQSRMTRRPVTTAPAPSVSTTQWTIRA